MIEEHPAIVQLRDHQRQLDADGCEVGVSRQAIEETLEIVGELLEALYQYRNDLRFPVATDSKQRRLEMIDRLIAKSAQS